MIKYSLTITILCMLSLLANAQEDKVSLQFVSFPVSGKSEPIELFVGDEKSIKIELPTTCLSPIYKVPALNEWMLGEMTVNDDGEKTFKSFGKIKSTGGNRQLILVIRKGATYKDGFEMIPLNYDTTNFSGGQYFMMNATKVDIGIKLGSTEVGLRPNKYQLTKPKDMIVVEGKKQIYIKVYFRNKEKMKPFYSSTWRFNEKARSLIFFYHEPHNKRIRTHTIRDYIRQK